MKRALTFVIFFCVITIFLWGDGFTFRVGEILAPVAGT